MRVEFIFSEELVSKEKYLSEAASWVDSMRNGTSLKDGRILKDILSNEEKKELENYLMEILMPEIKIVSKAKKNRAKLDYDKAEDFQAILTMKVYEDFYKFNNVKFLVNKEKQYTISTFIDHKAREAMRDMMIAERDLPVNAIRNLRIINDTVLAIAEEEEISLDAVSPLMVYEKLSDRSISYKMVIALMDVYHGVVSIDEMEDNDDRLQDNTMNFEGTVIDEMDQKTRKVLDSVFGDFSKLELYIMMKEFGFLGDEVRSMTAKEISYKDYFVTMAREDKDGDKNIEFGDVHIKRPGRNSMVEEVLVESVFYVKEKFYNNKVAKIKKKLASLASKVAMNDIAGSLESYCINMWDSIS